MTLDFSPDSVDTRISSRTARLNQSRQWVNLTKIEGSFAFDPILVNFQIYNDTRDWRNRTYFDGRIIDRSTLTIKQIDSIDLLSTSFSTYFLDPKLPSFCYEFLIDQM
ncbi:MAG: hypothetical protein ACW99Q_12315 [Candidatus Kariarchaeaceae archaeon]